MSTAVVASAAAAASSSPSSTVKQQLSSTRIREEENGTDRERSSNGQQQAALKIESNDTVVDRKPAGRATTSASTVSEENHSLPDKVTAETANQVEQSDTGTPPLPSDLRRILVEVAQTGRCAWLPWNPDDAPDGDGGGGDHDTPALKTLFGDSGNASGGGGARAGNNRARSLDSSVGKASGRAGVSPSTTTAASTHQRQQPLHPSHRRPAPLYASARAQPRKKRKNGTHVRQRRFCGAGVAGNKAITKGGRKRPLFLIRTTSSTSWSVGSARTSGSEPEDTSTYECDSEGSSTTNSEFSFDRRDHLRKRTTLQNTKLQAIKQDGGKPSSQYKSLREVVRTALGLVLDYMYVNKGGYTLSPAEKRINNYSQPGQTVSGQKGGESNDETVNASDKSGCAEGSVETKLPSISTETVFQQRRQRILNMLGSYSDENDKSGKLLYPLVNDGPPFTIQRISEVLIAPERFYTRTHKLCNCLEKLLLVTSSISAFGGGTGGDTSQSRREEKELAALASEKGRLQIEFRQRRHRRKNSSSSDDVAETGEGLSTSRLAVVGPETKKEASPPKKATENGVDAAEPPVGGVNSDTTAQELLEAAARASLRTKFDHVGIDPHSSAVANRDVRSIAENRSMTNSPPPPGVALQGHGGLLRQHHSDRDHSPPSLKGVPSPILFPGGEGSAPSIAPIHANPSMHILQMNHAAAALGGVSPLSLVTLNAPDTGSAQSTTTGIVSSLLKDADMEIRSPASSDIDSESDDLSLDDSASDRSDDSASGHYEPLSAARAMALNRMQQQQRQHQNRLLNSLGPHHQSENSKLPAEYEYQSGDSIDSMRAEDSAGSDSSSSDVAD